MINNWKDRKTNVMMGILLTLITGLVILNFANYSFMEIVTGNKNEILSSLNFEERRFTNNEVVLDSIEETTQLQMLNERINDAKVGLVDSSVTENTPVFTFMMNWGSYGTGDGQFDGSRGIAINSSGYIYIPEQGNNRIQVFDSNGDLIRKWGSFGSNDGQFNAPQDVAINSTGHVYVTDITNARVQVFDAKGNFITKWGSSGSGDGQFIGPSGISINASGYVYVADEGNHRIQVFDANGNYITQWGTFGSGDGQFKVPVKVHCDLTGNVFVSEWNNHRIQVFDPNGIFITKWGSSGSGDGQFQNPWGISQDSAGNIYVVDYGNSRVQVFTRNGTFMTKWGSMGSENGEFNTPHGIAINSTNNVYINDMGNSRIQVFSETTGFFEQTDSTTTPVFTFVTNWGSYGTGNGQFNYPTEVITNTLGNIYVADPWNDRIQVFDVNSNFITKWESSGTGDGQFNHPSRMAINSSNYVYVSDTLNHRIQVFDANGNFITKWGSYGTGDGQFNQPRGIAFNPQEDRVYIGDELNHRIQVFDANGNFITKWGSSGTGDGQFNEPTGVGINATGHIFISERGNHRVQVFDASGTFVAKWGTLGSNDGQLNIPHGISVLPTKFVLIPDHLNHRIQVFDQNGQFLTKWGSEGSGNLQFDRPYSIMVNKTGFVFITDYLNSRVQVFKETTGLFEAEPPSYLIYYDDFNDGDISNWTASKYPGEWSVIDYGGEYWLEHLYTGSVNGHTDYLHLSTENLLFGEDFRIDYQVIPLDYAQEGFGSQIELPNGTMFRLAIMGLENDLIQIGIVGLNLVSIPYDFILGTLYNVSVTYSSQIISVYINNSEAASVSGFILPQDAPLNLISRGYFGRASHVLYDNVYVYNSSATVTLPSTTTTTVIQTSSSVLPVFPYSKSRLTIDSMTLIIILIAFAFISIIVIAGLKFSRRSQEKMVVLTDVKSTSKGQPPPKSPPPIPAKRNSGTQIEYSPIKPAPPVIMEKSEKVKDSGFITTKEQISGAKTTSMIQPPFYCQLCSEKHKAGTPCMQCEECGRSVCVDSFSDMTKVGRTNCPMCEGKLNIYEI